jgi:hypothetical protein
MKILSAVAQVVGFLAIVLLLTACSSPSQLGLPEPIRPSVALPDRGHSWMARSAKALNLLYISDVPARDVDVFSYPAGRLLGKLTGFEIPNGECVDKTGDVFVTDGELLEIREYAHGGTRPLATLSDPGAAEDCSIDPMTGDLAVANSTSPRTPSGQGDIAIYKDAKGTPKTYANPDLFAAEFCAYDGSGNLFVSGRNYSDGPIYTELPKGTRTFRNIRLRGIKAGGSVQWDGGYVVLRVGYHEIDRVSGAKVVGTTVLKGSPSQGQFWIQGNTIILPQGLANVGFWSYPGGGKPAKTISGFDQPFGVTVSMRK